MKTLITIITIAALTSCADMPLNISGFIKDENTGAKAGMINGLPWFKAPIQTESGQTGYIEITSKNEVKIEPQK